MATQTACRKFRTSSLRGLAQQELKLLTLSLLFSGIGGLLNGFLRLTCRTLSAVNALRSRQRWRRSSSPGVGALTMAQTRGSPRFVGEQRSNQRFTIDLVGLCPPAPARRCNRGRVDDVAFHAFALERPVNPKPVKTGLLYNDDPKALTRPQPRLLLKLCEALQQPAHIAAMHCCFDIFSPPPGDSEVISQLDRLNSSETKIAPRSVRIAVGASSWSVVMFMVSSKNRWQQPFHLARESIATSNTPWDLEKDDVQTDPIVVSGKAETDG